MNQTITMKKLLFFLFAIFFVQALNAQCSTLSITATLNNNVSCNGLSDGSATATAAGGTAPYSFLWDNGELTSTATGLSAGVHSVTVTDAQSCNETASVIVVEGPLLSGSIQTSGSSCSNCNGSATILITGGTAPYVYQWSNGWTTQAVNTLCPGTYNCTVTDANGCEWVGSVVILPTNPFQTSMTLINDVSCNSFNDGSAMVTVSGGDPPFTFNWSSGENTPTASMLEPGIQTVLVTDNNGCTRQDTILIGDNGVHFSVSSTLTSCNTADGTAMVTLTPPISNPSFQWSANANGATTASVSGLAEGWYSVTVVDLDNGCRSKKLIEVLEDPICVVTIEGYVFDDSVMPDCITDPGTIPFPQVMLCLSNGIDSTYTYTDSTGYYSFTADAGTYTVRLVDELFYDLACAGSLINIVNAPVLQTTYQGGDYYVEYTPYVDLRSYFTSGAARPGFTRVMRIYAYNHGSEAESGTMTFVHDPLLTNFVGNGLEDSYDPSTRTIIWSYSNLLPGDSQNFPFTFTIPASTTLGTQLCDTSYVTPVVGDVVPSNNEFTNCQTVTGAYDPNDKHNFVGDDLLGGDFYEEDTTFLYRVRFQNTGTDTAFTVVIRDTLESNLIAESLQFIDASHNYDVRFNGHNILEFWFENIMLPDSNVNEPASNGFVLFSIDRRLNLPVGTSIENTAAIYFDFNAPVITNTVVNTLAVLLSLGEDVPEERLLSLSAFPNPAREAVQLKVELPESGAVSFSVYDATGILVSDGVVEGHYPKGEQQIEVSTKDLADGVYFMRLQSGDFVGVARVVVMH